MGGPSDGVEDDAGSDGSGTDTDTPNGDAGANPNAEEAGSPEGPTAGPLERWEEATLFRVVVGITVVALVARFVALGARPAHWDEARVAYWANFYAETGSLGYHYEEHGPVVQIAARWLFEPFGVSDTAARLPVAVVGGLFPLSALLYRKHLRDSETVALALFLAFNSVLLYYSRFIRSDVLVAAFMFVTLGLVVRFADTRRYRYLYGAGLFLALGFGSKENAVIYIATWLGAGALVADQWLYSPASEHKSARRLRESWGGRWWRTLRTASERPEAALKSAVITAAHLAGAAVVALLAALFVFADRGEGVEGRQPWREGGSDQVALGEALNRPDRLPEFVIDTLGGAYEGYGKWFAKSSERTFDTYVSFVDGFLGVLVSNAPVVLVFAVLGFAVERYGADDRRFLVMFMSYCAVASLVGYPIGTDIQGAWAWVSTHIVVPLAVPAAVGLAWLYRVGLDARADRDALASGLVAAMLVLAALLVGVTAATDVYRSPQGENNELVQYAQPYDDLDPVVETLSTAASETDGRTAVLYYGAQGEAYDDGIALVTEPNSSAFWDVRPTCSVWSHTQPMNWYFGVADADVECERSDDALVAAVQEEQPPVIFAHPDDPTVPTNMIETTYERETYYTRTIGRELVVYTHESYLEG